MKRSPLKRFTPLRRAPLPPPRRGLARRVGLAPMSQKRRATLPARAEVREAVIHRDGGCILRLWAGRERHGLLIKGCFGPPTYHHRRKEGQGGAYSKANGVCLCAFHNSLIESDARFADWCHEHGLVVRRGDPEWEALAA